jgi:hypothetical protein
MDNTNKPYTLNNEDKATQVMIYTHSSLLVGEVVTKSVIRVSTWLRTPMVPQFMTVYSAQILDLTAGGNPRSLSFRELFLPSMLINAFHIRPPLSDPADYDPNEPMRKMEPVTVLVGSFRFDGNVRISSKTNLESYLDVIKEDFTSIYDIQVTPLNIPAMKPYRVPFALLRKDAVIFSPRART